MATRLAQRLQSLGAFLATDSGSTSEMQSLHRPLCKPCKQGPTIYGYRIRCQHQNPRSPTLRFSPHHVDEPRIPPELPTPFSVTRLFPQIRGTPKQCWQKPYIEADYRWVVYRWLVSHRPSMPLLYAVGSFRV